MKITLPEDVEYIIATLERAGYEAYAVGGCVRDTLLGRIPQDWDITTSAKPEEIKNLFSKTIDTGIQHGTVTVLRNHIGYEVTTYRIDGEYEDNRHPKSVEFTDNLKLDLERRDFTINAMAYNHTRGLVDEFDGIGDLERGIIRCVGDAGARFDEDALRMLRAVRFSGQLRFRIEEGTRQAILSRAMHLENISAERIRVELTKLLISKDVGQFREAYYTGMTKYFLPEFDAMMKLDQKNMHHIYTVGNHTIRSIEVLNYFWNQFSDCWDQRIVSTRVKDVADMLRAGMTEKQHMILCVTLLFHDIGKVDTMTIDEDGIGHFYHHAEVSEEKAKTILRRLTFDNETIDISKRLIRYHDYRFGKKEKSMRRAMSKIGKDMMPMLFLVQLSDVLAQNPKTHIEKTDTIIESITLWQSVLQSGAALSIKDLEITGKDIIRLGVTPGKKIGELLEEALEWVLETPENNHKEKLLAFLQEKL